MLKLKTVVPLAACACVMGLTACGSSDDDGATASSNAGSSSDPGVATAKKFVAEKSKTPTSINVDEPLEGKPATGKKIIQLKCAVPECQEIYDGLAESAKVVGWTTQDVNMGPTPEEVNQAFDQALALKPAAIVISGIPLAVWQTSADKAKAAGVPVLNISSTDKATGVDGNGLVATLNGPLVTGGMGTMTGNFAVADSGGKANVALFNIPDFPTLKPWADETQKAIKATCGGCKSKVVNAEVGDIGSKLPQTIVSTIQQDPDINYVALAFGGMATGVRPALDEAGFNDVKIIGEGSVASNLEALRGGKEQMWAAQVTKMQGWYATDILLRHFNDQELGKLQNDLIYPTQILTPDNAPKGSQYLEPADYQQQFKKLWGLG